MVNINLSAPEAAERKILSGKSSLIFSVLIVAATFSVFFGILFMKNRYESQGMETDDQIALEKNKLQDASLTDAIDFRDRLNLLDKAVDDHSYWDSLLLKMGAYVLPEVRLNSFSGKVDAGGGGGQIEISGTAASLDALSRELILLKSFPDLDSLEFKQASASQSEAGLSFGATLKIKKSALQK